MALVLVDNTSIVVLFDFREHCICCLLWPNKQDIKNICSHMTSSNTIGIQSVNQYLLWTGIQHPEPSIDKI